jgi:1-deoxyxylulose-5-phosphate synthase
MEYRNLGKSGLKVSRFCLGTMTFGRKIAETTQVSETEAINLIKNALASGINFIDTADIYPIGNPGGSEEVVGKALKGERHAVVLATKVCAPSGPGPNDKGLSRSHIMNSVEDSLRRLQTDYLDVYFTHSPDYDTSIEETLRAFDDLIHQGKVRYIGCSNFAAWQMCKALGVSDLYNLAKFVCIESPYNILARDIENELLPACENEGIGVCAYNPLAGEMLTGRHELDKPPAEGRFTLGDMGKMYMARYWSAINFEAVDRLKKVVKDRGCTLPQFALAWILKNNSITSILTGTISNEQLKENLASTEIKLTAEEIKVCEDIWQIFRPTRHSYIAPKRKE